MKKLLFLLPTLFFLAGCMNFRHDVSESAEAWRPYDLNSIYDVKTDVFLMEVGCCDNEPIRYALVPSREEKRGGLYSSPNSIQEYLDDPVNASKRPLDGGGYYEIKVVGIVKAGTKLKPIKVMRNSGYSWWGGSYSSDYKYVEILSGEFKGEIVDIEDITLREIEK